MTAVDEADSAITVTLEQQPLVEGALIAIENRSGRIKAMVGGWSFNRSKFNRAVQAYRQLGSTFKPVVYTAAVDRGFTPVSLIVDAPVAFDAGSGQVYSPQNYDHKFDGPVTLRHALEDSRNIPAVKMMDTVGPANVLNYAKKFGFSEAFPPYLAIALGAGEATLMEVTSAYTVFPNGGVRMKPIDVLKVMDREGNTLEENRSEATDAIRADTAFVMTNLLRGVIQRGTGAAATSLNWPLGGKTGTVDDNTDAWFIGFDPDITVGVWTGHDEKKPIGRIETGAVAALPIWMEFMTDYIAGRGQGQSAGVRDARQHRLPAREPRRRHAGRARCRGIHQRGLHLRHPAGRRERQLRRAALTSPRVAASRHAPNDPRATGAISPRLRGGSSRRREWERPADSPSEAADRCRRGCNSSTGCRRC